MVLLAEHLQGDTPILIYRVERLESTIAALHARGWTAESGPFEIPNGPCYTFRDPTGVRLAIYENQRPDVDQEFAGRFDSEN
jgi:predicted enzyme related to lactoylglutathione lyase